MSWWKSISIVKRLYFVVGVMALLIVGELLALRFAMINLSAARAFVGGESTWAKAQKNAVFSLQRYGLTRNPKDYESFVEYLKIPKGDHEARLELLKPEPDYRKVFDGFVQGHIHPDDVKPMYQLLRRFYWISYLSRAIQLWTRGDELLFQLIDAGSEFHDAIDREDASRSHAVMGRVKDLNEELTQLEEDFSASLGEGSRWLEHVVLTLLFLAVLTVESIGLTLTFLTSRALSRGLTSLTDAATRIGQGEFGRHVEISSRDELGRLGEALNQMSELLEKSYGDLEARVRERTAELKAAVQMRDEFLSVASHELRTPLTALSLQLQMVAKSTTDPKALALNEKSISQTRRLAALLDHVLDLTRIRLGRLEINPLPIDLSPIVRETVAPYVMQATRAGSLLRVSCPESLMVKADPIRIGQVVTNLVSNAIKYGRGAPIEVVLEKRDGNAVISVRDEGSGIPADKLDLVFERFERAETDPGITGLGLGLYITREIIHAHGGEITVESKVGSGSVFRATIPAA